MIYEIINPSDEVTIESEDPRVAQWIVLMLGRGMLGMKPEDDDCHADVPLFGFRPETAEVDIEKWLLEAGIGDVGIFLDNHRDEIVECLEGMTYGSISDRRAILKTVGKEGLEVWNDEHRSSLNDYHAAAHALADDVRDKGDDDPVIVESWI